MTPASKPNRRQKTCLVEDLDPMTTIKKLRKQYGSGLAPDWDGECTLGDLLRTTGFASLTEYVKHHGRRPADDQKRGNSAPRTEQRKEE